MRITEKELIIPALYVIDKHGQAKTEILIKELTKLLKPTGEDINILPGRKDTKFSQKVRNLKSHRDSNGMAELTNLKNGSYSLTDNGKVLLKKHFSAVEYLDKNNFKYEDTIQLIVSAEKSNHRKETIFIYDEDSMLSEGEASNIMTKMKKRSLKLRNAAIEHYRDEHGNIKCSVCDFCFKDKYGLLGNDFIEIHHEKPVYQYSDKGFNTYISTALANVKPVCSNCHKMLHRKRNAVLSIDELKNLLR